MQTGAPADRQGSSNSLIQNLNDCQYLTIITYTSANSLCSVVWLGGVDCGGWSAGPCGLLCGGLDKTWPTLFGLPLWPALVFHDFSINSQENHYYFLKQYLPTLH